MQLSLPGVALVIALIPSVACKPNPYSSYFQLISPRSDSNFRNMNGRLDIDILYMKRALELAARGLGKTRPNPAVGCVILSADGNVVGEGFHPKAGEPHAEVFALRQAGELAKGGTAYVSLEPCNHYGRTPPCTEALISHGIKRVVAGMVDPDPRTSGGGLKKLADNNIDTMVGILGAECRKINRPFIHRILFGPELGSMGVLHIKANCTDAQEIYLLERDENLLFASSPEVYEPYDAIIVEGKIGLKQLENDWELLPSTMMRIILVPPGVNLGTELLGTETSPVWRRADSNVMVLVSGSRFCDVASELQLDFFNSAGIPVMYLNSIQPWTLVSKYLYSIGYLLVAWEVDSNSRECILLNNCTQLGKIALHSYDIPLQDEYKDMEKSISLILKKECTVIGLQKSRDISVAEIQF